MKKLIVTCIVVFCSATLFAQEQEKPAPVKQEAQPAKGTVTRKVAMKNYCCPMCDYTSAKPGSCPHHSKALIRDGMYYCEDGTTSREPGKCKDGKEMIRMIDKSARPKEEKKAEPEPAK